eukprot:TRINITY_DN620_c0_g1_i1.p1 TRINITY_DN620_c0_g1~~TRINITY_DN620_c0_g1_i1.p1  ORF type:complete len:317 (+),score=21.11 TRINITY_DN620_c0_g1_i1:215-1165(+)
MELEVEQIKKEIDQLKKKEIELKHKYQQLNKEYTILNNLREELGNELADLKDSKKEKQHLLEIERKKGESLTLKMAILEQDLEVLIHERFKKDTEFARLDYEQFKTFECSICFEDIVPEDQFIIEKCEHKFCRGCAAGDIENSILEKKFPIVCSLCKDEVNELSQNAISMVLSEEMFSKYLAATKEFAISRGANFKRCTKPDCKGEAEVEPPNVQFICPECHYSYCVNCEVEWHPKGVTCESYQKWKVDNGLTEDHIADMVKKGLFKFCPVCKTPSEKISGCNFVVCRLCQTKWCWVCARQKHVPHGCNDASHGSH